jgi:hypothetical protein
VLTIINDEIEQVRFDQSTYSVDDTDTTAVVTLIRTGATNGTVSVDFSTSDGSAKAGINYTATSETVTFSEGVLTNTVSIPILPPSGLNTNQTVRLTLTNPTAGASLGTPNGAVLTIVATGPPVIQFSAANYRVHEHVGRGTVTAIRFGDASDLVTVDYATSDGTAISGVDYFGTSGTLVFAPGDSQRSFSFQLHEYSTFQSNKTVNVSLSLPSAGASLGTQDTAVVTIVNDKPQTITFTNSGGGVVTLQLRFAGTMEVLQQEPLDLLLSQTDPASVLTIKAKKTRTGIGSLEIDQIAGAGGCRSIDARDFDVTGSGIELGDYLKNLRIHDLLNGATITANGAVDQNTQILAHNIDVGAIAIGNRISNLQAARFGHGATINAPRIGTISIRGDKRNHVPGDCDGVITVSGDGLAANQKALGKLSVSGTISNASIAIANGSVGTVTALRMIDGSTLYIGYTPDDPGNPLAGGTFIEDLQLGSVSIRSSPDGFVNSDIAASKVGNVHLASILIDNADLPFGVVASQHISAVTAKTPSFKWIPTGANDQSISDFHVIH